MKKLLDEDDKNRRPVVPVFLRSCAGWGLALIIVGAATWFLLKPQKEGQQKDTGVQTETRPNQYPATEENSSIPAENDQREPNSTELVTKAKTPGSETTIAKPRSSTDLTVSPVTKPSNKGNVVARKTPGKFKTGSASPLVNNGKQKNPKPKNTDPSVGIAVVTPNTNLATPDKNGEVSGSGVNADQTTIDNTLQKDSANKAAKRTRDSLKKRRTLADSVAMENEIETEKEELVVSAGIGLQQQIPLGGQKAVPYDYYGRTGSLSDYIPSFYLRVEKEEKWFVQGEFRYGAPQTLADFQYSRQTKVDSQNMTVTSFRLKKTYYH